MTDKKSVSIDTLYRPFARSIREQLLDFERPLPKKYIREKVVKEIEDKTSGKKKEIKASYVPWPIIKRLADHYSPGWTYEIVEEGPILLYKPIKKGNRTEYVEEPGIFMKCRVSIQHAEPILYQGEIVEIKLITSYREATAFYPIKSKGYGDAVVNCEAKVLRRCWGRWGIGLHLWQKDGYVYRGDDVNFEELVGDISEDDIEEGIEEDVEDLVPERELDGEKRLAVQSETFEPKPAENIAASTLYDILVDAGCNSRPAANRFSSLVLGFEVTKLERVSPEERVRVLNVAQKLRMTLNKVDARERFVDWLLLLEPATVKLSEPADFYDLLDGFISDGK